MKKINLLFVFVMLGAFTFSSYAQTLNQNANWPNTDWSLTGTYNTDPSALEADPTLTSNFAFDDDDAGPGHDDDIAAESPIIDLTAAYTAGERAIIISGNFVYNYIDAEILQFEYWDVDASTWNIIGSPFNVDTAGAPTDNYCSGTAEAYTTDALNIAGFTATQLSGFRYRIYFDDTVGGAGYKWGFCFDAPTIISTACPEPSGLTATAITDTTANLGWTQIGTATLWNVELVDITAEGTATGTATASGVANPYMATGLTPDNNYEFWVQAQCGGGTTNWVGPFAFRTTCVITAAPYTEDFEMFTTANDAAFAIENCWTGTGGAYFWESAPGTDTGSVDTGPAPSITTGNYFYSEASDGATGDTTDLISPVVDLSALTAPALTFNYHMFGDKIGTLDILVNGITNVWTLSGEQQASETTPWELAVVDLSAYANQAISITFRATSADLFEGDIAIDNVSFTELPTCSTPSELTAANITDTTADLGWTENGTATSWNIELVDITAGGTVTGTATTSGVTNPYTATGLTPDNNYEFYVQADCGGVGTSNWVGPFAFRTTCAAIAAPYTEDFETFTTGGAAFTAENCWTGTDGEYFWKSSQGTNIGTILTGPNPSITTGNYFYSEATDGEIGDITDLRSPLVDLTALTEPVLIFNYHMFGESIGTLDILVNGVTNIWTLSGEQQTSGTAPWELVIVDLSAYANQPITITFRATRGEFVRGDISIDNVSFTELTCAIPSELTATTITDTTADLGWTENGSATAWDVAIVPAGTTPTATATAVSNPYTATGLTQNTEYDFYVRTNCGADGTSNWVGPVTFTTDCTTIAAPYTEDFETFTTGTNAFTAENCWIGTGGTYYWESAPGTDTGSDDTGPDSSITTGNYFYTESSTAIANTTDLISPVVDLTALTAPALTFNYHMFGDDIGTLDVLVNGTTNVWTLSGEQQASATSPWELAVIDLATYANQSITITFRATKVVHGFQSDISIDNVSFTELPSCPAPTALTVTNITDTTADLSWTENGTATSWNIELVDVTAGETATGTATATGVTNPYTATGLIVSNTYAFYVQADCGVDGVSAWAGPYTFITPYVAVPPSCTNGIFLDSGGPEEDYSNGETITYTITPDTAGGTVSVYFSFFSTESSGTNCFDGLTIYNGEDDTAATINPPGGGTIWCWDRDDVVPEGTGDLQGMTITSTDPSGALTFVFTSDSIEQRAGWEATVNCHTLTTQDVDNDLAFSYYPNPVNETLFLQAQNNIQKVSVYNMLGQEVLHNTPNSLEENLDLSALQTGTYFVKVTIDNATETVRIIKN
ncbi:fibronectin type III domain-containing protein [uncultured Psychroserpens sp.]|uniref:fibronectin type III domain-containing protein n=1 Tax=uncultured Psychroserpens sp. TaxID=255436 RepID=UPI002630621D|nr:fibronectin type III domain-containing protein [uncultured Psychroserpens sp.]